MIPLESRLQTRRINDLKCAVWELAKIKGSPRPLTVPTSNFQLPIQPPSSVIRFSLALGIDAAATHSL